MQLWSIFDNFKLYFVKSFVCNKFKLETNKFGPWTITIMNHGKNDATPDDLINGYMYINVKSFKKFGWLKQFMIPKNEILTEMLLTIDS